MTMDLYKLKQAIRKGDIIPKAPTFPDALKGKKTQENGELTPEAEDAYSSYENQLSNFNDSTEELKLLILETFANEYSISMRSVSKAYLFAKSRAYNTQSYEEIISELESTLNLFSQIKTIEDNLKEKSE